MHSVLYIRSWVEGTHLHRCFENNWEAHVPLKVIKGIVVLLHCSLPVACLAEGHSEVDLGTARGQHEERQETRYERHPIACPVC